MFNSIKKILKKFYPISILIILISSSFLLIFFYEIFVSDSGVKSIYQNIKITNINQKELHKGDKVSGEFVAVLNELGVVWIRFNTFGRINSDILTFKIREKGQNNWYYENLYRVDQFQDGKLFPFGFPPITNSLGKDFQFEIISNNGVSKDAVTINPRKTFFSGYGISLKSFNADTIQFLITKLLSILREDALIIFITPFIDFLLFKIIIKFLKRQLVYSLLFVSLVYIFLFDKIFPGDESVSNPAGALILVVLFILIFQKFRIEARIYIFFSIIYLTLIPLILLILNRPDFAEKSALLAYLFLILGVIFIFIEIVKKPKNLVDIKSFLESMLKLKYLNKYFRFIKR